MLRGIVTWWLLAALVAGPASSQGIFGWLPFFGRPVNATSGVLGGVKQVVNTVAGVKSSALQAVTNATKQALDLGANVTARIPLVGPMVGLGTNVMKAGVNTVNSLGQAKISFFQNFKNAKLTMVERFLNATGGLLFGWPTRPTTTTTARPTTTTTSPAAAGTTPTTTATTTTTTTTAPTNATTAAG